MDLIACSQQSFTIFDGWVSVMGITKLAGYSLVSPEISDYYFVLPSRLRKQYPLESLSSKSFQRSSRAMAGICNFRLLSLPSRLHRCSRHLCRFGRRSASELSSMRWLLRGEVSQGETDHGEVLTPYWVTIMSYIKIL